MKLIEYGYLKMEFDWLSFLVCIFSMHAWKLLLWFENLRNCSYILYINVIYVYFLFQSVPILQNKGRISPNEMNIQSFYLGLNEDGFVRNTMKMISEVVRMPATLSNLPSNVCRSSKWTDYRDFSRMLLHWLGC